MIDFFSNKLGYKYPWAKYSQVVVRDYVSGAMENTTATIFMEALQQNDRALADNHWDYIIAHELFHHWFGDLVTCESWANLPLNESFANYSEYLWFEHKYGIDEADHHGENEATEYFDEAKRKQVPLIRYHYKDREDMFDRHSYNKGGRILHMLRKYVGDEAFFESLKLYLSRNQFKPAEVHNLRLAFEEVTGEDLNWFFNQWFLASGHPELEVTQNYTSGLLSLNMKQIQDTLKTPIYKLPLKVDVWVNGFKNTYLIVMEKVAQNFEIKIPGAPNLIVVDSDFQLLGKINHQKSLEENIFQYKNYPDRYLGREFSLKELFMPTLPKDSHTNNLVIKSPFDSPEVQEVLRAALKDSFWSIRELALDQFSYYTIPDLSNYLRNIETIALSDPKPSVRAKAIYLLSSISSKEYVPVFIKAMNEKPYSVAGAGFASYLKSGDTTVPINYSEWEGSDNVNIVIPLANYYSTSGTNGKYDWFVLKLKKGSPRVIYNLMEIFKDYVLNVEPGKTGRAKEVIEDISKNNKYEQIRSVAKVILEDLNEKTK
jgi:aminopeptidase N